MEQTLLLWGFALMAAALLLIVVEVFIPSGGVIGLTAGVTAIASVVIFWRVSAGWGLTSLLLMLVLVPIALNFAIKLMPNTPVGKRLILTHDQEEAARKAAEQTKQSESDRALVGAIGTALTSLRPVGTVEIEGTRLEALAEGGVIESGSRVRVTSVQGPQVKVRAIV
jgi:membrane-bound ClpP family serine protease